MAPPQVGRPWQSTIQPGCPFKNRLPVDTVTKMPLKQCALLRPNLNRLELGSRSQTNAYDYREINNAFNYFLCVTVNKKCNITCTDTD